MAQAQTAPPPRSYPFPEPPAPGTVTEVSPGILWARFALPFQLDHVNVYILEDGDGWAVIDAGIGDDATRAAWEALLAGPLAGRPLRRLIVTHHHPDHVGLAGWLCRTHDLSLEMPELEYLYGRLLMSGPDAIHGDVHYEFYRRHGMDEAGARHIAGRGHAYLELVTGLPETFTILDAAQPITIGGRRWEVLKGGGHAPDQAMLYARDEKIFIAADQVLDHISPNVSVPAIAPESDPLSRFLETLDRLRTQVTPDALTLPGHRLPIRDPHVRIAELADHHARRCDILLDACRARPLTMAEAMPHLFSRALDEHQTSFAIAEALAHANHLVTQGRAGWQQDGPVVRLTHV